MSTVVHNLIEALKEAIDERLARERNYLLLYKLPAIEDRINGIDQINTCDDVLKEFQAVSILITEVMRRFDMDDRIVNLLIELDRMLRDKVEKRLGEMGKDIKIKR